MVRACHVTTCGERSRTNRKYIHVTERMTNFKELAHMIMETGQPKIWCSSSNAVRQENLLLKRESAFCSSQSTGWMRPIHIGEGSLPDSAYRFTCSSYPQTPSQTHQNNVRINNWAPWPVTSTHSKIEESQEARVPLFLALTPCLSLRARVSTSQRMIQGLWTSPSAIKCSTLCEPWWWRRQSFWLF